MDSIEETEIKHVDPPTLSESGKQEYRMKDWEKMHEYFTHIVDGNRRPIDDGILNAVIALNIEGVTTWQSCEGHARKFEGSSEANYSYPFVDIRAPKDTPETSEMRHKVAQIDKEIDSFLEETPSNQDVYNSQHFDELSSESQKFWSEIRKPFEEMQQKLVSLLDEFYSNRHVSYLQQLVLNSSRLQSIGAVVNNKSVGNEETWNKYQEEMNAFADYLKNKYIGKDH